MEEALTILLQYGGHAIADISKRFKEIRAFPTEAPLQMTFIA